MTAADLPAVNASLNGVTTVLLVAGFWRIKRGDVKAHRACMLAAFGLSSTRSVFHTEAGLVGSGGAAVLLQPESVAASLGLTHLSAPVSAFIHPSSAVIPALLRGCNQRRSGGGGAAEELLAHPRVLPPSVPSSVSAPPCLLYTLVQQARERAAMTEGSGDGAGGAGGGAGPGGEGSSTSSIASDAPPVWHSDDLSGVAADGVGGVSSQREDGSRWGVPQPQQPQQRRGVYSGGGGGGAGGASFSAAPFTVLPSSKGALGRSISASLGLLGSELVRDLTTQQQLQQPATPPNPPFRAPPVAVATTVCGDAVSSSTSIPSPLSPVLTGRSVDLGATVHLGRRAGGVGFGSLAEQAEGASSCEDSSDGTSIGLGAEHREETASLSESSPAAAVVSAPQRRSLAESPSTAAAASPGIFSPYSDAFEEEPEEEDEF